MSFKGGGGGILILGWQIENLPILYFKKTKNKKTKTKTKALLSSMDLKNKIKWTNNNILSFIYDVALVYGL